MDAREAILEAAARLFAEKGFNGTTTREIAEQAGVAEITLFRHFGTKKELLLAVLTPALAGGMTSVLADALLADAQGIMPDVLSLVVNDRLNTAERHKYLFTVLFNEAKFHEDVRAQFGQVVKQVTDACRVYLERHASTNQGPARDPELLAYLFVACIVGLITLEGLHPTLSIESWPREEVVKTITGIFREGGKGSGGHQDEGVSHHNEP